MAVEVKFGKKHKIKEDHFIEGLFKIRARLESQKKNILFGLLGVLIIVLLAFGIRQFREGNNIKSQELFGQAMMEYQNGKYTNSIAGFKRIVDEYGSSRSAPKALFLIGGLYYELGNYTLSVDAYQKYIGKYDESEFLNAAVYKGLGSAYIQMRDYDNAISAFKTAIRKYPDDFSIPELRYKLARCLVEKKDTVAAKSELENLKNQYPASFYSHEADLLLATL
ncbi:MAG: hypothetical protein A2293_15415 [Elusimicrobia bacterium RIFOXYB2_FULL_49_7]|nr:MAG: hypothetical protein A2293_15415 [Elusimicrobia bacterium RIFOXYB2_FULL_49_7]